MNWSKQAEVLMETWTEAQKKMWENWYDLAHNGSKSNSSPDIAEQWRWWMDRNMQVWTATSGPTVKGIVEQMTIAQTAIMRFLELATQAWQVMAPKVEAGEDWQSVLRDYTNQWFQQWVEGPAAMMSAGKETKELWRFYIEGWQKLTQPWLESWGQTPGQFSQAIWGAGSELAQLSQLHWDAYERSLGRMTEMPQMGFNRELMAKLLSGFDTWVEFRKASLDYRLLLAKASAQAFEQVMKELVAMSERGEKIDSVRQLMNLWMDTVDHTFSRLYKAEEYLRVQRELSAAVMKYRMQEQEIVEIMMNMLNLPTRSELDDAYRSLYELRKEVKALKKAIKERDGVDPIEPKLEVKKTSKPPAKRKPATEHKSAAEPAPEATASEE